MQLNNLILLRILILHSTVKLSISKALLGHNIRVAEEKEFPFVVSIGYSGKYEYADEKHICTGALISRWHVLTAAHCLDPPTPKVVQVTIGSVDLRKGRAFSSSKWLTYDDWADSSWFSFGYSGINDIAVLKLTEEVSEPTIQPAKLWCGKTRDLYNKDATVVGWGCTDEADNDVACQLLQAAPVKILSGEQCRENAKQIDPKHNRPLGRHLYTKSEPHVLLGNGDSGGPLVYKNHIIVGVNHGLSPNVTYPYKYPKSLLNDCRINSHVSIAPYRSFIEYCSKKL